MLARLWFRLRDWLLPRLTIPVREGRPPPAETSAPPRIGAPDSVEKPAPAPVKAAQAPETNPGAVVPPSQPVDHPAAVEVEAEASLARRIVAELIVLGMSLDARGASSSDLALLRTLTERIERKQLELPTFPAVARQVEALAGRGDVSLRDVAGIIDQDPELVRRVWRGASSAVYGNSPKSLHHAVVRLGLGTVWQYAMGAGLSGASLNDPRWRGAAEAVRQHAIVASEVAGALAGEPRGPAFLGGLLHDAGRLVILNVVADISRKHLPSEAVVGLLSDRVHALAGAVLAHRWQMPPAVVAAVIFHHSWQAAPAPYQPTARLVHIADLAAHEARPGAEEPSEPKTGIEQKAFDLAKKVWERLQAGEAV